MQNTPFIFLKRVFTLLIVIAFAVVSGYAQKKSSSQNGYQLVIGTYTNSGKSEGIYTYHFNSTTGSSEYINKIATADPSFIAFGKANQYIYAVYEQGNNKGSVSSFGYDKSTGTLLFLNTIPSGGDHPCYVSTDGKGRFVFVANYTGGSFSAIRIKENGYLDTLIQTIQHTGKSIHASRQEKPHVHSTVLSPDEKFLLVQDLGTDQISVYAIDLTKQANPISAVPVSVFNTVPGSGPRHLTFHPTKNIAYSVQELNGTVNIMRFKNGKLNLLQEISMKEIPAGKHGAADIHISPDGKFLYASNRGDFNELVIYKIGGDGKLSYLATQSTLGKAPRNFGIDPTGNFLLVGNQQSNEIVVFKRNRETGLLTDTGNRIKVGAPVCIQFVKE